MRCDVKAKLVEGMDEATAGMTFDQIVSRRDNLLVAFLKMQRKEESADADTTGDGAEQCTN